MRVDAGDLAGQRLADPAVPDDGDGAVAQELVVAAQQPVALVQQRLGDEPGLLGGLERGTGDGDRRAFEQPGGARDVVELGVLVVPPAAGGVPERITSTASS